MLSTNLSSLGKKLKKNIVNPVNVHSWVIHTNTNNRYNTQNITRSSEDKVYITAYVVLWVSYLTSSERTMILKQGFK